MEPTSNSLGISHPDKMSIASFGPFANSKTEELTLENGWVASGASPLIEVTKIRGGPVSLSGIITPGTIDDNTTILTTPEHLRPSADRFCSVFAKRGDGTFYDFLLTVTSSGAATIAGVDPTTEWASLDNTSWRL